MTKVSLLALIRDARKTGEHIAARDALLERGYSEERITRALDTNEYSIHVLARSKLQALKLALSEANGRKRQRTLTLHEVVRAMDTALATGRWGWCHGGYPESRSYSYRYTAVAASAVIDPSINIMYVGIMRTDRQTAPFGLGRAADRATNPETIAGYHDQILGEAMETADVSMLIEVAKYIVKFRNQG